MVRYPVRCKSVMCHCNSYIDFDAKRNLFYNNERRRYVNALHHPQPTAQNLDPQVVERNLRLLAAQVMVAAQAEAVVVWQHPVAPVAPEPVFDGSPAFVAYSKRETPMLRRDQQ